MSIRVLFESLEYTVSDQIYEEGFNSETFICVKMSPIKNEQVRTKESEQVNQLEFCLQ